MKLSNWINAIKNHDKLLAELHEAEKDILQLENEVRKLEKLTVPTLKKISVDDSEYWNSKWEKSVVFYNSPKRGMVITHLKDRDIAELTLVAKTLMKENNFTNPDQVPIAVLKWLEKSFVSGKFTYQTERGEEWSTPEETLKKRNDDCDGWGIVEYYLIRTLFKQLNQWDGVKHRLKCLAGNVNNYGSIPSQAGGHFYLNWLHSDGEWYTVESTYYRQKAIDLYGQLPQKLNPAYGTIWFSFNSDWSWSNHSLTISREDFKKLNVPRR